jgi:hypothetical protein
VFGNDPIDALQTRDEQRAIQLWAKKACAVIQKHVKAFCISTEMAAGFSVLDFPTPDSVNNKELR